MLLKDVCSKLGISKKHLRKQKLADYHYQQNAAQMRERYNKKMFKILKLVIKLLYVFHELLELLLMYTTYRVLSSNVMEKNNFYISCNVNLVF